MRRPAIGLLLTLALVCGAGTPDGDGAAAAVGQGEGDRAAKAKWRPDVRAARRYAKRRAGAVSFAVIDQRGRVSGFGARGTAPMASTLKVVLMAAHLRRAGDRRLRRRDRALLAPMIRRSDNAAASRLTVSLGGGRIARTARSLGMRRFRFQSGTWGLSRSSALDQVRMMRRLDDAVPRRHRGYAKRLLSRIVPSQRWGVGDVRHRGWRLMFKGGWGSGTGWVDHQAVLLERGRQEISLAVFTRSNPSHGYGKRTLRGIFARLLRGLPRGGD